LQQLANDLSRLRQENSELQARVDKCTRDSEQRNLVRDRHGFILRKERVNKLNGMQSTLTKRLEEIKQFEAKVYALLHVATNRFRSGEEKLRYVYVQLVHDLDLPIFHLLALYCVCPLPLSPCICTFLAP